MKNIAFKRAKTSKNVENSLHPEFITEYADISLFAEGFHKPEDGYEILEEDKFLIELSKNDTYHKDFLLKKEQEEKKRLIIEEKARQLEILNNKQLEREFKEFRRWKEKNKGKG